MTDIPFPTTLSGYEVIEHHRVASREDEPPLAVVLRRDPGRLEDRAYEVCDAALRGEEWKGFNTEHSMSKSEAEDVMYRRIALRSV